MGSDSIAANNLHGSVPASKDFGRKKRTNRLAKLKQCKLDARREQWLSQVTDRTGKEEPKKKGSKEEINGGGGSPPQPTNEQNNSTNSTENQDTRSGSSLHDSDLDSSPASSVTGRKDRPGSSCGSSISSTSSSMGCCSGNFSEEEDEEDDGCLDDWEAVADALTADEKQKEPVLEPEAPQQTNVVEPVVVPETRTKDRGKAECKSAAIPRAAPNCRAWRPDDTFRPQSLPNLSKQYSFPTNVERFCSRGGSNPWTHHNVVVPQQPTSCPICYEDLDLTDSSFHPCPCGFRLCLFCHKRILEADARCPGCRKQYDPINGDTGVVGVNEAMPFRLSRSYSMNMRA